MTILYVELAEKLKRIDEVTLMELLEISSEDIVERFGDKIEEKYEKLVETVED